MLNNQLSLAEFDPVIAASIAAEAKRQEEHIELIASENHVSSRIMEAQGSVFTNKYAEGYPNKRYYGGCVNADVVETVAIERAKELFQAGYANVQPHSGSQANAAVFQAFCNPGDVVLGMSLAHGGHLTHGASVSFSGRLYKPVQYGINEAGLIDYEEVRQLAKEHRPKMIIAGFSAYSQIIDWAKFREIADEVGAKLMVDIAHVAGLVAAGLYPNPVPYADAVTSTTHKTLRGPRGGLILTKGSGTDIEKQLDSRIFPGTQGGPLVHIIAAKAIAFKEALTPEFKDYQKQVVVNAKAMVSVLQERGLSVVSGGTECHMFLLSLVKQGLTGKEANDWLEAAHITANKNSVPNDPQSPFVTSGVRIGTAAITSRGFVTEDCKKVAHWIADILEAKGDQATTDKVLAEVAIMCKAHPVYSS